MIADAIAGIARAAGAKPERRLALALILAALPFYFYFTWVINSTATRIWIFTASLLPYRLIAIYYCLSYRHGLLKQSLRAMAYLLAFDTLANLWRASQSSNVQYLLENSRSVTVYGATSIISLMSILAMVTLLAVVSKLIGCGLAAWPLGKKKAAQVGMGMVPRGEVGIVVAQIGLSLAAVTDAIYGVVLVMAVATTLIAPPFLVRLFKDEMRPPGEADESVLPVTQIS